MAPAGRQPWADFGAANRRRLQELFSGMYGATNNDLTALVQFECWMVQCRRLLFMQLTIFHKNNISHAATMVFYLIVV